MLDLSLLRTRSYSVGVLTIVGVMTFYAGFIFAMTMYLQFGLGLSALQAGLTFGPMGLGFAVSSLLARPMLMRYGTKVIRAGQALLLLSTVVLLLEMLSAGSGTTAAYLVVPLILSGAGTGVTLPALTGVVMSQVSPQRAGVASGLLTTAQQFANTIGVAVFGVVFFGALGRPSPGHYADALQVVAACGVGLSLLTLAATFLLPRTPVRPPQAVRRPVTAGAASE